jgi:hypothetical protein
MQGILHDGLPLVHTIPAIHLGHFGLQLLAVALHEAANGIEGAPLAVVGMAAIVVLLVLDLLQKGVYGFLFGISDETAGVDDDQVTVVLLAVEIDLVVCGSKVTRDVFRVDGVLAAT